MTTPPNAVVLGVPPDGLDAGLDFAVAEAVRWNCPLHLVNVLSVPASYAGPLLGPSEKADRTLLAMVAKARARGGANLEITTERCDDAWVVDDLVRRGDRGRMVVLEHQPQGLIHRLVLGSTASGVAARAVVPVVSVPADWVPGLTHHPVVTVAVQDAAEAQALLPTAFEEASVRDLPLAVLHAWWLYGYDLVVDEQMCEDEQVRFAAELASLLDQLRADHPGVVATLTVRHAPPVEAVLDAAAGSHLLVLGRRHHLLPLRTHLGPVARAVLEHSVAPVMLTPQTTTPRATSTRIAQATFTNAEPVATSAGTTTPRVHLTATR